MNYWLDSICLCFLPLSPEINNVNRYRLSTGEISGSNGIYRARVLRTPMNNAWSQVPFLFAPSSTYTRARDRTLKDTDFINRGHRVMDAEKCAVCRRPKVYKLAPYQLPVMEKFINSFNYVPEPSWPGLKSALLSIPSKHAFHSCKSLVWTNEVTSYSHTDRRLSPLHGLLFFPLQLWCRWAPVDVFQPKAPESSFPVAEH